MGSNYRRGLTKYREHSHLNYCLDFAIYSDSKIQISTIVVSFLLLLATKILLFASLFSPLVSFVSVLVSS